MDNKIFELIICNDIESIKFLVNANLDLIKVKDKMGRTPVMEAVIQNNFQICHYLIDKGFDVVAQEVSGWTALHFAAQEYNSELVKLLLENNASIDLQDNNGNTPLFRALFNSKGDFRVIKILLDNGANKNLENNSGISPYDLAKQITNFDFKKYFE